MLSPDLPSKVGYLRLAISRFVISGLLALDCHVGTIICVTVIEFIFSCEHATLKEALHCPSVVPSVGLSVVIELKSAKMRIVNAVVVIV